MLVSRGMCGCKFYEALAILAKHPILSSHSHLCLQPQLNSFTIEIHLSIQYISALHIQNNLALPLEVWSTQSRLIFHLRMSSALRPSLLRTTLKTPLQTPLRLSQRQLSCQGASISRFSSTHTHTSSPNLTSRSIPERAKADWGRLIKRRGEQAVM